MNINQTIEEALKDVVPYIWPLCAPEDSAPETYIVYAPELEKPELYADDEDQEWVHYMRINLFQKKEKGSYLELRKKIREKLREAGFTLTDILTFYESETGYYHLCFECYLEEE